MYVCLYLSWMDNGEDSPKELEVNEITSLLSHSRQKEREELPQNDQRLYPGLGNSDECPIPPLALHSLGQSSASVSQVGLLGK